MQPAALAANVRVVFTCLLKQVSTSVSFCIMNSLCRCKINYFIINFLYLFFFLLQVSQYLTEGLERARESLTDAAASRERFVLGTSVGRRVAGATSAVSTRYVYLAFLSVSDGFTVQNNLRKMNFIISSGFSIINIWNELILCREKLLLQLEKAVLNLLCSLFSSAEVVSLLFNKYVMFLSIMPLNVYH